MADDTEQRKRVNMVITALFKVYDRHLRAQALKQALDAVRESETKAEAIAVLESKIATLAAREGNE